MSGAPTSRARPLAGPLRLGIDGRALEPPRTGVGRYVTELCRGLDGLLPSGSEVVVYARRPVVLPVSEPSGRVRWRLQVDPVQAARRLPATLWTRWRTPALARRDRLDVFWGCAAFLPVGLDVPSVVTVHDLLHLVAPESMVRTTRLAYRRWFAADVRRARVVLTNSAGTAERLRALVGVRADAVVRPAAGPEFRPPGVSARRQMRERYELPGPYFLCVGTGEPRKNLSLLVGAFADARAAGAVPGHSLIVAGPRGAAPADAGDGVRALGYVAAADLPALYAESAALVFPSRYEGFGMPALEARACGARVIATDLPELREAGGPSAVYVPATRHALAHALGEVWRAPAAPPEPACHQGWDGPAQTLAAALGRAAGARQLSGGPEPALGWARAPVPERTAARRV